MPTTGLHGLAARLATRRGVGPVALFSRSCAAATGATGIATVAIGATGATGATRGTDAIGATDIGVVGAGAAGAAATGAHETQGRFVARPADPGVDAPGRTACGAGLAFAAAGVRATQKDCAAAACIGVVGGAAPNIGRARSGAGLKGRATVLCGVIPAPCGEAGMTRPGDEAGT